MKDVYKRQYLNRLGHAVRSHTHFEGDFMEFLKVCSEDKLPLRQWPQSEQNYTRPTLQNEIIQIIENGIIANFTKNMKLTNTLIYP